MKKIEFTDEELGFIQTIMACFCNKEGWVKHPIDDIHFLMGCEVLLFPDEYDKKFFKQINNKLYKPSPRPAGGTIREDVLK
jgi:hypothetical protein